MREDELGKVFSEGEIIFKEGDEGDRMYVVQAGKVKITKKQDTGELTIATLETGEIFGEMAMFDRMPRSATAVAMGEARVLGIEKKKLFQSIDRDPTLVFKVIESMSRRIRSLDEEFTKLKKNKTKLLQVFMDINRTCTFVIEEAKNTVIADNGSIMIYDEREKKLEIKAAFGTVWEPKTSLGRGEGIAGDVLSTGKAELINNVSMDARFKSGSANIMSMLCAPLKGKNNPFGVINMSRNTGKLFTVEDLKLLRTVAIYASIAIENAMNFTRLHDVTDEFLRHASLLDIW